MSPPFANVWCCIAQRCASPCSVVHRLHVAEFVLAASLPPLDLPLRRLYPLLCLTLILHIHITLFWCGRLASIANASACPDTMVKGRARRVLLLLLCMATLQPVVRSGEVCDSKWCSTDAYEDAFPWFGDSYTDDDCCAREASCSRGTVKMSGNRGCFIFSFTCCEDTG
jgi:hypothetical protein